MKTMFAVCLSVLVVIAACNAEHPAAMATGDPAIANTPQLYLPGIVSTSLPEFAFTLAPDGREMYFNRTDPDRTELRILHSQRVNGAWSTPIVAPFSGQYRDVDPFITADGKRLYFSSDRPRDGIEESSFSTWYVERTASGWSEPIDPGSPVNSTATDIFVSATRGGELVFNSQRDGVNRVYTTREIDGKWREPLALQFGSVESAGNPRISADGNFMILVIEQEGSGADLFYSCKTANGWQEPVALTGGVNSGFADFAPALDYAGEALFFTSERPGVTGPQPEGVRPPGDIYQIALADAGIRCE